MNEFDDTTESEPIFNLKPTTGTEADYRELGPITICPCGSNLWNVKCKFDEDGEIGYYFLDMQCALCGSLATAPIPNWDTDEDDESIENIDDIFGEDE